MKKIILTFSVNEKATNLGEYLQISPDDVLEIMEYVNQLVEGKPHHMLKKILQMNESGNKKLCAILQMGAHCEKFINWMRNTFSETAVHERASKIMKRFEKK